MQATHWVFTLNLPNKDINNNNLELLDLSFAKYSIYQLELSESGTFHYQGYVELKRSVRLTTMCNLLPGAHFERRQGSRVEARNYSSKEDTRVDGPWESGTWEGSQQGRRSDLLGMPDMLEYQAWRDGWSDKYAFVDCSGLMQ